jgi:hypothetical protein
MVITSFFLIILLVVVAAAFNASANAKRIEISSVEKGVGGEGSVEYEVNDPGLSNGTVTSKTIADELLNNLLKRIGGGRGPHIVGGIGDSGTRGVRDVMIHLGAQMLGESYVNPVSKDSQVYMDSYVTTTTKGKRVLRSPPGLYNMALRKAHSLKYNSSSTTFDHWHLGRQYVAKMVDRSMTISQRLRRKGAPLDPWGFKHPRTALLLPFWLASLGDKFVFIHVLRDGKDIIEGENQKVFHDACSKYYGQKCREGLQARINFWSDLNREVFEFVLESDMKANQYMAIRVEDLVMGNTACYKRLARYLNMQPSIINDRVDKAAKANQGHEGSYLGKKWSHELKTEVEAAMMNNPRAKAEFEFWGYKADDYVLATDCESLQWMERLRQKKGPLPGDS